MAFRTKKISQMDPKGANLASTDLLEISQLVSGSYVTKSITGAEIISGATTGFVPTSRTLTINGTTQDLSADRTFTISTGITIGTTAITSGTVGRVLFEGTGNVVSESANLFWDNTNGRLGVGTSSPSAIIHSVGSVTASGAIGRGNYLNNTLVASANSDVLVGLDIQPTFTNGAFTGVLNHSIRTSQNTGIAIAIGDKNNILGFTNPAMISLGASYGTNAIGNINNAKLLLFDYQTNGSSNAGMGYTLAGGQYHFEFFTQSNYSWSIGNGNPQRTVYMRMFNTGNLTLQNGGTFTDAGFKLDVNGTARVKGAGATSATSALTIQNSAGTEHFRVQDDGVLFVRSSTATRTGSAGSDYYLDLGNIVVRNGNGTAASTMSIGKSTVSVASSIFELVSTTKGFLPPRMTTTEKNAIATPAAGLVVYDSTLNKLCVRTASAWETITSL